MLPNEKIFYLGDTARVPYGGKSAGTVERYSLEIADILIEENAKIVVVACNTASSVALRKLEEHLPVPVTGVIRPGARAAIAATQNNRIGVIGTRATIKSGAYERELRSLNPEVHISSRACPLLVPLIEEGWLEDKLTDRVIARYLEPLVHEGIDTLVLGCTHYPLLTEAISRAAGDTVKLVDSAHNCAVGGAGTFGSTRTARAVTKFRWLGNCVNRCPGQFPACGSRGVGIGDRRSPITRCFADRGEVIARRFAGRLTQPVSTAISLVPPSANF